MSRRLEQSGDARNDAVEVQRILRKEVRKLQRSKRCLRGACPIER